MRFYPFVFTGEEHDEETSYGYCDDYQPHAVKRMFDYNDGMLYDMRWDEAGNLGQVSIAKLGDMFEAGRFLFWTEDNRMHAAVDDRYYSYYAYDHNGERRLKLVGDNCSMDVNAEYMNASSALNEPTLYPSAYMVLTNKGYTNVTEVESRASSLALPRCSNVTERKHYYAGTLFLFFHPTPKNIKGETFRPRESTTWIYRPIAHELVSDGIGMSACDCNIPDTYFRQNDLG